MKVTKTILIPFIVSFDNWDKEKQDPTKEELKNMAIEFLSGYSPMSQMTLGENSGDLVLTLKNK